MNKEEIIEKLKENHTVFIGYLESLSEEEFEFKVDEKWTAGQQLEHIIKSVKPLNKALIMPDFAMKKMFGESNRPSRTFDGLVEKYQSKLKEGGKASGKYIPDVIAFNQRDKLISTLKSEVEKLCKKVNKYDEEKLDKLILPHPLLGKLTLREMFYFTFYHVEHHKKSVGVIITMRD